MSMTPKTGDAQMLIFNNYNIYLFNKTRLLFQKIIL